MMTNRIKIFYDYFPQDPDIKFLSLIEERIFNKDTYILMFEIRCSNIVKFLF